MPIALVLLASPASAAASTYTVDDDRAQCPNASFTSIQAAVEQAAPFDTVVICDGDYGERSQPLTTANSPSQPGSMNGVTITKPLTIRGAGADRVTIHPAASLGGSLAGTSPFLRDGGGNVITVSRQSLGSSDETENFVDISGVTVESPNAYVEAGIAFFNTSGRVYDSVVGPLQRPAADQLSSRPHGWGVIMTNSLIGASEATVRRQVTVENSLVSDYAAGGVLFDAATGADGTAATTTRSGILQYGYVKGSRIAGAGLETLIGQTGVRYHAGARGSVTGSEIADNLFAGAGLSNTTKRQSVGILLTDAQTGPDPSNPAQLAFSATNNSITGNGYGVFHANITNDANATTTNAVATDNWWGCSTGPVIGPSTTTTTSRCQGVSGTGSTANVDFSPFKTLAPAALTVPVDPPDAAPAVAFSQPATGDQGAVGVDAEPVVTASDDIGVRQVQLFAGATLVSTKAQAPYEFSYTPTAADAGTTVMLRAVATDSSGQTTQTTIAYPVAAPATPTPTATPTATATYTIPTATPTATPPYYPVKVTPGLSLKVRPKLDKRKPFKFAVSGKVKRKSAANAAACKGRVKILVKKGGKTIAKKTAKVRSSCLYTAKVKLSKRAGKRGTAKFTARFGGNAVLNARSARAKAKYGTAKRKKRG